MDDEELRARHPRFAGDVEHLRAFSAVLGTSPVTEAFIESFDRVRENAQTGYCEVRNNWLRVSEVGTCAENHPSTHCHSAT